MTERNWGPTILHFYGCVSSRSRCFIKFRLLLLLLGLLLLGCALVYNATIRHVQLQDIAVTYSSSMTQTYLYRRSNAIELLVSLDPRLGMHLLELL